MAFGFNKTRANDLVAKVKSGDEDAFAKLYKKFSKKIYFVARKMEVSHEDAEGIVQEVFLKIWRNRSSLNESLSINAYLLTITRSLIINESKKKVRFHAYKNYAISYFSRTSNETEDYVIFSNLNEVSSKVLEELPTKQRQVFMMKNFEHLSVEMIAERLQVSKRTVENQVYRANKVVKKRLGELKIIPSSLLLLCSFIA